MPVIISRARKNAEQVVRILWSYLQFRELTEGIIQSLAENDVVSILLEYINSKPNS